MLLLPIKTAGVHPPFGRVERQLSQGFTLFIDIKVQRKIATSSESICVFNGPSEQRSGGRR